MPREQVNYPDQHAKRDAQFNGRYRKSRLDPAPRRSGSSDDPMAVDMPEGVGPFLEPVLHVTWHPEGRWVQMVLEVDLDGLRERIREHDEAVAKGEVSDDETMWLPSTTLSPSEIDALIGYLRRAKRKAFAA